ncbi:hypothetical protein [Frankia sp. CiP3]|uniref:hypothetical protein n=1 Tax=Frankia sp. CiP3 TaxID=2880971 RepID=UPI001EF503EB|nr:hypothetical protein [Frankia sp. CiP3]
MPRNRIEIFPHPTDNRTILSVLHTDGEAPAVLPTPFLAPHHTPATVAAQLRALAVNADTDVIAYADYLSWEATARTHGDRHLPAQIRPGTAR